MARLACACIRLPWLKWRRRTQACLYDSVHASLAWRLLAGNIETIIAVKAREMTQPIQLQRSDYGRGSWLRARAGKWKIPSELLQEEVPEIYEMALDLLSIAFGHHETRKDYTRFVIDIKPERSTFLHPGRHGGKTTVERCYLILDDHWGVLLKPSGCERDETVPLRSKAANDIGDQLRSFMQMCMENFLASEAAQRCADSEVDPESMVAAVRQAAIYLHETRLEHMRRKHAELLQRMLRERQELERLASAMAFVRV